MSRLVSICLFPSTFPKGMAMIGFKRKRSNHTIKGYINQIHIRVTVTIVRLDGQESCHGFTGNISILNVLLG